MVFNLMGIWGQMGIWERFDGKLWQRNYYEHIIRSSDEYERVANYIINNPAKWVKDKSRKKR